MFQNDFYGAIEVYHQAIEAAKDDETAVTGLKGKIADAYVLAGDFTKALAFRNALADEAKRNGDDKLYIEQQQQLAAIFFKTGATDKALDLLKTTYKTSL